MNTLRLDYPLPVLCRVLEVSRSGYYAWRDRPVSKRVREEARLEVAIKAAHVKSRKTYAPDRLQKELAVDGITVGICRIRRIRKRLGIQCKQVKKFKATTNSVHTLPVAANLLNQNFEVNAPNEVWLTDITYISTDEGWLYCAAHKDLFNNEIVGYALSPRMTKDLVMKSLLMAIHNRKPGEGLIHHSDRGSQYCATDYQKVLTRLGIVASMSGKGNCYDNAPMESFWGTLKNELVYHQRYVTREQAIREITEYIEIFYNRQRRQARLGYLSPVAYGRHFSMKKAAA
jgi:putative transposase